MKPYQNTIDYSVMGTPSVCGSKTLHFSLDQTFHSLQARCGRIQFHGVTVETPTFMPVGTIGVVKGVTTDDLESIGYKLILANTYHIYLRPGLDILQKCHSLPRMMDWKGLVLTDSGGFQVMSLAEIRRLTDDGVTIANHLSGEKIFFSPESVVDIQHIIGSHFHMVLDQCQAYGSTDEEYVEAMKRTHLWAKRARDHHLKKNSDFAQLGIVQGAFKEEWRKESVDTLVDLNFEAYAIGGLSVGEPRDVYRHMTAFTVPLLPYHKLRYIMGIGRPADLLFAVLHGADVFDCVVPTRHARNGSIFVRRLVSKDGVLRIKRQEFATDLSPLDPDCSCQACTRYSRAYLRHLFKIGDIAGLRLLTLHNLQFFYDFFHDLRQALSHLREEDVLAHLIRIDEIYAGLEEECPWKEQIRAQLVKRS